MDLSSILHVYPPAFSLHCFAACLCMPFYFMQGFQCRFRKMRVDWSRPQQYRHFSTLFASPFSPCLLTLYLITVSALRGSIARFRPLRDFKLQPPAFHTSFGHLSRRALWRLASAEKTCIHSRSTMQTGPASK